MEPKTKKVLKIIGIVIGIIVGAIGLIVLFGMMIIDGCASLAIDVVG